MSADLAGAGEYLGGLQGAVQPQVQESWPWAQVAAAVCPRQLAVGPVAGLASSVVAGLSAADIHPPESSSSALQPCPSCLTACCPPFSAGPLHAG